MLTDGRYLARLTLSTNLIGRANLLSWNYFWQCRFEGKSVAKRCLRSVEDEIKSDQRLRGRPPGPFWKISRKSENLERRTEKNKKTKNGKQKTKIWFFWIFCLLLHVACTSYRQPLRGSWILDMSTIGCSFSFTNEDKSTCLTDAYSNRSSA